MSFAVVTPVPVRVETNVVSPAAFAPPRVRVSPKLTPDNTCVAEPSRVIRVWVVLVFSRQRLLSLAAVTPVPASVAL